MDKIEGFLEVGTNGRGEVVINHPKIEIDADGCGHVVFSTRQAEHLAQCLIDKARDAAAEAEALKPPPPPVDRSQVCLTDGRPVEPDHRELTATGQQKGYVVLTAEERAKGFVRPVRRSYRHVGRQICGVITPVDPNKLGGPQHVCVCAPGHEGTYHHANVLTMPQPDAARLSQSGRLEGCGTVTTMGLALAETYARDPKFYSGTFCCGCGKHFPVDQFVWDDGIGEPVGS